MQPLDYSFERVREAAVHHGLRAKRAISIALMPQLEAGAATAVPTRGDHDRVTHDVEAHGAG